MDYPNKQQKLHHIDYPTKQTVTISPELGAGAGADNTDKKQQIDIGAPDTVGTNNNKQMNIEAGRALVANMYYYPHSDNTLSLEADNADSNKQIHDSTTQPQKMELPTDTKFVISSKDRLQTNNTEVERKVDKEAPPSAKSPDAGRSELSTTPIAEPEANTTEIESKRLNLYQYVNDCYEIVQQGDKSYRDFQYLCGSLSFLMGATKRGMEEDPLNAQRHSYQAIADTMMLQGGPLVTDRTKEMIEETVLFQMRQLHLAPTMRTLGDFWDGMKQACKKWEDWNIQQVSASTSRAKDEHDLFELLDTITYRVQGMISDQQDIRLRYFANMDNWMSKLSERLQILRKDWDKLIRTLGLPNIEERKVFDNWLWNEFQKTVRIQPQRAPEVVEECVHFVYTYRLLYYSFGADFAIDRAKEVSGFEEYRARSKEGKNLTLLGALPNYKSVDSPPMEIEEVKQSWQSIRYSRTIKDDLLLDWEDGKPGRSFKSIFKAFHSIRGTILLFEEKGCKKKITEVNNPRFEEDFRDVLKVLKNQSGYSQLPTMDLLKLLHRAAIELDLNMPGEPKGFIDKMDSEAGPITLRDLDSFIAQWEEKKSVNINSKLEKTGKRKKKRSDRGLESNVRNSGDGKDKINNGLNNIPRDVSNKKEKIDGGRKGTSGDAEQEEIEENEDMFVDAQEDIQEDQDSISDGK